jgi:hypothetical protein
VAGGNRLARAPGLDIEAVIRFSPDNPWGARDFHLISLYLKENRTLLIKVNILTRVLLMG